MAESPQGLHDSRFSGSGPHTTTRGASAPAVLGDLAAAERHTESLVMDHCCGFHRSLSACGPSQLERWARSMAPSVFGVMSNHVGTPTGTDVRRLPRPPDAFSSTGRSGAPIVALLAGILIWGSSSATLLRTKHCDLASSLPPFLPPGTRGVLVPRAWRSRPGLGGTSNTGKTSDTEKHLWLDSL